ncbi:MAG TPA: FHA domain-containing protein [Polyangiales bacterium]
MTQDHNKKTLRQFQCRDYLWEIFEQMGAELECSTDYLVNEAMRQYARSRNWGSRASRSSAVPPAAAQAAMGGGGRPAASAPLPQPVMSAAPTPAPAPAPVRPPIGPGPMGPTAAPPPIGGARKPAPSGPMGTARAPTATGSFPPPLPGGQAPGAQRGAAAMPSLFVIFNGQKVPVNKEEFVIGRGSKTADLPIKDGNISRRHAAIVLQNGAFYMKDLGSTNGIEFAGVRVDTRRIEEGDVYHLCDYELRFTYQP